MSQRGETTQRLFRWLTLLLLFATTLSTPAPTPPRVVLSNPYAGQTGVSVTGRIEAQVDAATNDFSINLQLDGIDVLPEIARSPAGASIVRYTPPEPFTPGSWHAYQF